jgi:hypothetical protein
MGANRRNQASTNDSQGTSVPDYKEEFTWTGLGVCTPAEGSRPFQFVLEQPEARRPQPVYFERNHNATIQPAIPKAIRIQQNLFQSLERVSGAKI